ncbi:hypothetical protein Q31b_22590 [Novipirellula aureliae]|uniref:DUF2306 domain-containing protein n=1 Tax=Novipirellula aureliae TaxID=2527966 RepID=A0A5C6E6F3_9BACT|nr:DUF2306 domain-containing protein [Novipirellula aureliae]TWU43221.1 hypothetical protein Q31b_22590 [Novipirellula aureliae]
MKNRSQNDWLLRIVRFGVFILLVRVLLGILFEYRYYFPPDFNASAFLSGRRYTFFGFYRAAFYVHIVTSPLGIVVAMFLVFSGGRQRYRRLHRWLGKALAVLVIGAVLPSGLWMASQAYAGKIAAAGFVVQTVVTAIAVGATVWFARQKQFAAHQRWAIRSFLLLISPLILRLISGTAIVLDWESDGFYRFNAWVSWMIPLLIYQGFVQNRLLVKRQSVKIR